MDNNKNKITVYYRKFIDFVLYFYYSFYFLTIYPENK